MCSVQDHTNPLARELRTDAFGPAPRIGAERRTKQRLRKRFFRALEVGREPPQAALELGSKLLHKHTHRRRHSRRQAPQAIAPKGSFTAERASAIRPAPSTPLQLGPSQPGCSRSVPMGGKRQENCGHAHSQLCVTSLDAKIAPQLRATDACYMQRQKVQSGKLPQWAFSPAAVPDVDRFPQPGSQLQAADSFVQPASYFQSMETFAMKSHQAVFRPPPPPPVAPPMQIIDVEQTRFPHPPQFAPGSMIRCATPDVQPVKGRDDVPMMKDFGVCRDSDLMDLPFDTQKESADGVVEVILACDDLSDAAAWPPINFVLPCHVKNTFIEVSDGRTNSEDDADERIECAVPHAHRAKSVPACQKAASQPWD